MLSPELRAKYQWRCRRGMLELDLILEKFIQTSLDQLSPHQLKIFSKLLECHDPDLYSWLMGYSSPVDQDFLELVTYIRSHFRT